MAHPCDLCPWARRLVLPWQIPEQNVLCADSFPPPTSPPPHCSFPVSSFLEQSLAESVASGNVVFKFGKSPLSPFI